MLINQTISSREIARATGKEHHNILKAIRKMEKSWVQANQVKFNVVEYRDGKGEKRPEYQLTKTQCLYVATKFNDEARVRLILRWEQLEQEQVKPSDEIVKEARKACRTLELGTRMLYHYRDALRLLGYSTKGSATKVKLLYGNQMMLVNKKYYVSEEYLKLMISRATARQQKKHTLQASPVALPENFGSPLNLGL